jgi:Predicted sugar kinase
LIDKADIIGIGPGLGTDDWAVNLYDQALASEKHVVLDADALNILSSEIHDRGNWTLTPHPGEAARILDSSVSNIQSDRINAITEISNKYSANVLLKGKITLIKCPNSDLPFKRAGGNPGMANSWNGRFLTRSY